MYDINVLLWVKRISNIADPTMVHMNLLITIDLKCSCIRMALNTVPARHFGLKIINRIIFIKQKSIKIKLELLTVSCGTTTMDFLRLSVVTLCISWPSILICKRIQELFSYEFGLQLYVTQLPDLISPLTLNIQEDTRTRKTSTHTCTINVND